MNRRKLFLAALVIADISRIASADIFTDDFESYVEGGVAEDAAGDEPSVRSFEWR